jgi:hypothetical protein
MPTVSPAFAEGKAGPAVLFVNIFDCMPMEGVCKSLAHSLAILGAGALGLGTWRLAAPFPYHGRFGGSGHGAVWPPSVALGYRGPALGPNQA